jgi:HEAT repeat protein
MGDDTHRRIRELLASAEPDELREGLALVKEEIARKGSEESRPLFEAVSTIFYIDPLDRPDLVPALDEAVSLVVGFGDWVIPVLIRQLEDGDFKAQMAVAHALGRIGADAIAPLLEEYRASTDPGLRQFVLYTLSKIKSPMIVQAGEIACDAARSEDRELRDTAMRTIGKLAEPIPPADLPAETRQAFVSALRSGLADSNAGIRAKAVRSLGKLARFGHLDAAESAQLRSTLEALLGRDDRFEWDRAYLVRKEAEEALGHLSGK